MKYKLEIYTGRWGCDAGCCSDIWSELTLTNPEGAFVCQDYETRMVIEDYNEHQDFLDFLNKQYGLSLTLDNCEIV